ncbi:MAG TPA: hypothetical protein VHE12_02820 [bacterium]|nr:hypothetical protein [bacterium]
MSSKPAVSHGVIFGSLVVLVLLSVGTKFLVLPVLWHNLILFGIATVMAALVLAQYMGLRLEGPLVVWAFIIPVVLFVILTLLLMPDIGHVRVEFLKKLIP